MFTTDNGTTGHYFSHHEGRELIREKVFSRIGERDLQGKKGTFTDWGMRVPALISWPGHIEAGSTSDALIDLSDLLPTFVDLAGEETPGFPLDGKSFAPLLLGEEFQSREWVYGEAKGKQGIRTRDWKLVSNGQLFDMENDPEEQNPILAEDDTEASANAREKLEGVLSSISDN
jgi:arylsulfatase A-like enzyme